jgi:hypothetical protein
MWSPVSWQAITLTIRPLPRHNCDDNYNGLKGWDLADDSWVFSEKVVPHSLLEPDVGACWMGSTPTGIHLARLRSRPARGSALRTNNPCGKAR